MSFLSRYWKQVERQVSETGMNPGDVYVDIDELLKNTEVPDAVEPVAEPTVTTKPQAHRPIVDEPMSQYAPNPDAWETRARRSARPGKRGKGMEARETFQAKGRRRDRDDEVQYERKATTRKTHKAQKGEDVYMSPDIGTLKLKEVTVNGQTVWCTSSPD